MSKILELTDSTGSRLEITIVGRDTISIQTSDLVYLAPDDARRVARFLEALANDIDPPVYEWFDG